MGGLNSPFSTRTVSFPGGHWRHTVEYEENQRCFGEGKGVNERANQNVLVLPWYVDNS